MVPVTRGPAGGNWANQDRADQDSTGPAKTEQHVEAVLHKALSSPTGVIIDIHQQKYVNPINMRQKMSPHVDGGLSML